MKNINLTKKTVIAVLLLTALNFITFGSSLKYNFIDWDDTGYVTGNKTVTRFDVKKMFTKLDKELYKPVTLLSFAVEYKFFKDNPFVYRLNNLILHSANAILLLCLIYLLTKSGFIAFLCALVFSVHPLHVESVVWIAERKDVLYLFFMLLSFILYLRYKKRQPEKFYKSAAYWLSNLMLVLSLGVKPMAVTLPVMLILTDWFKGQKLTFKNQRDKIPYFITAFIFVLIPVLMLLGESRYTPQMPFGWLNPVLTPLYNVWFYTIKTFIPVNLSAYYSYPIIIAPLAIGAFLGAFLLAFVLYKAFKQRNSKRFIGFGAGLFLFSILPVCGLVSFHRFIAADRYTYFAQTGIVLIAAYFLFPLWKKHKNFKHGLIVTGLCTLVLAVSMAGVSFYRSTLWQSRLLIIDDAMNKGYADAYLFHNKGVELFSLGQYELALECMDIAVKTAQSPAPHLTVRAKMHYFMGDKDKALQDYDSAFKADGNLAALTGLADVLINQNKCAKARDILEENFKKGIAQAPLYYVAGNAYNCLGNTAKAIENLEKAIKADSGFMPAYKVLESYYIETGDKDKAKYYKEAQKAF